MNWDQIEGKWKQFGGKFREKWGRLTDDDWQVIGGKKDQLVGRIQERYGISYMTLSEGLAWELAPVVDELGR